MSELYLVYKRLAKDNRKPFMIMPFDETQRLNATEIIEAVLRDDTPEDCLLPGEAWELVHIDEADRADLALLLPEDAKNQPKNLVENDLSEEETQELLNCFSEDELTHLI